LDSANALVTVEMTSEMQGQRLALIDAISTSGLKLVLDYHSSHDGVVAWLQGTNSQKLKNKIRFFLMMAWWHGYKISSEP
jgi:hypothetical protein